MVFYILYLVLFFIYFILYWLLPFFIRSPLFLFGPLFFIWHPPFYLVIKDQFIFICHPFAPAPAAAAAPTASSPRPRFSVVVDYSYLQKNVLELWKYAKHTINMLLLLLWYTPWYMIYFKHAPVFLSPYYPSLHLLCYSGYPSVTPQKKTTSFYPLRIQFIHFKKVLYCIMWRLSRYIDNVRKNKKVQCQRYGLTMYF